MSSKEKVSAATVQVVSEDGRGSGGVYEAESGRQYVVTNNHVISNESDQSLSLKEFNGEHYGQIFDQNENMGFARLVSRVQTEGGLDRGVVDLAVLEVVQEDSPDYQGLRVAFGHDESQLGLQVIPYNVNEVIAYDPPASGNYIAIGHPGGVRNQVVSEGYYRFQARDEDGSPGVTNIDNVRITSFYENGELVRGSSGTTITNAEDGIPIAVLSNNADGGKGMTAGGNPIHHAMTQIQTIEDIRQQGLNVSIGAETAFDKGLNWSFDVVGYEDTDAFLNSVGLSREIQDSQYLHDNVPSESQSSDHETLEQTVANAIEGSDLGDMRLMWIQNQVSDLNLSIEMMRGDLLADIIGKNPNVSQQEVELAVAMYIAENDPRYTTDMTFEEIKDSEPFQSFTTAIEFAGSKAGQDISEELRLKSTSMQIENGNAYQISLEAAELLQAAQEAGTESPEYQREAHDLEALSGQNIIDSTPFASR